MIQAGDRILAGVSGGPDSVFLVRTLAAFRDEYPFALGMAHVNHGLRKEAAQQDAAFVAQLAGELNLPLYNADRDVMAYCRKYGLSVEHGARKVRYDFFYETLKQHGYTKIALGHHADDNAEMVLMALLRGSGPMGLAGIPPVRGRRVIRPLIEIAKMDICRVAGDLNWSYVTDETNLLPDFLRNRIRLELLPLLKKHYNPNITATLNRTAKILRAENHSLEKSVKDLIVSLVSDTVSRQGERGLAVPAGEVASLDPALQRRLIREMIRQLKGDLKKITYGQVEAVTKLIRPAARGREYHLPDRILACIENGCIAIYQKNRALRQLAARSRRSAVNATGYAHGIEGPAPLQVNAAGLLMTFDTLEKDRVTDISSAGQNMAFFDIKKAKFPMILRNLDDRDRFIPLGMTRPRSVRNFLKSRKLPAADRMTAPVLVSLDQVIWVVGHQIDNRFKVTDETKKILKVEIQGQAL